MAAPGMAAPKMAAFWMSASWYFCWLWASQKLSSYLTDFEQVKNYFTDFEQVKKTNSKTPLGETGCLCILFWPWPYVTSNPPWLLRPVKVSTSSELYPNTQLFFECLGIQFFNSPLFFLTQSVRLPLFTYPSLCRTYVTYRTPCHASGHQVLPTQTLPRKAEDFPRGENHSKHVPLPTYLAWLQPIYYSSRFVFTHVKTTNILLVVKTLIKNIEQQPH